MRIFADFSAMESVRNGNFQPCSTLWRRVNRQLAADQAHTLFDHAGTAMCCIELRLRRQATKSKSQAVVGNQEFALSFLACPQADYHIARSAMFPYVRESLLNDTHDFVTYARLQHDPVLLRLETDRDTSFTPESCYQFRQKIREFLGTEVQGLCFLDQIAKVQGLLMDERLQSGKPFLQFARRCALASENFNLHVRTQQRLDGSIVQFACEPGAHLV